jgi:hypothetical protein
MNRQTDRARGDEPMTEAQAYVCGWRHCMAGFDGRYLPDRDDFKQVQLAYAYHHGWLDAMEAEDNEEPEPACAGY